MTHPLPHASVSRPWSGPPQAAGDEGCLFAERYKDAQAFFYDRALTQHAFTDFAPTDRAEVEHEGRRWTVVYPGAQAAVRDMLAASVEAA